MKFWLSFIENVPGIFAYSVKPMEKIDTIKIMQVEGLGGPGARDGEAGSGGGNLADQVVSSALRYKAQAPIVESLLQEIGLKGTGLNELTRVLDSEK